MVYLRQVEKAELFRKLHNLKGKDKWKNVYFNDDLTELQAIEQRDLRALVAYAKKIGREAKVKTGAFWYEGRRYRHEDLHRLPQEISLLKAKTLYILDDKAIVFQSPHSPLSNLFPCNILYEGEGFLSTEGAYQCHRARISVYDKEADLIKSERNPYKVKKIAATLRATREWEDVSEKVMKEILMIKYSTIPFCKKFLLETGEMRLLEGTGDKRLWNTHLKILVYHSQVSR